MSHDEPNSLDEQVVSCVKKDASKKIHSRVRSARQNVLSIASAASSKGWGNVEPSDSYGYKVDDISKKLKKLNIKSDFFSRKSFEELGCSDYIIESLGNQNYIRPSHIQVNQLNIRMDFQQYMASTRSPMLYLVLLRHFSRLLVHVF